MCHLNQYIVIWKYLYLIAYKKKIKKCLITTPKYIKLFS